MLVSFSLSLIRLAISSCEPDTCEGRLLLRDVNLCPLTNAPADHVRRDHDQQFVVFGLLAVGGDFVQPGNLTEPGNSAQREGFAVSDFACDYRGLAIHQRNAALVFAVTDDRHTIDCLTRE